MPKRHADPARSFYRRRHARLRAPRRDAARLRAGTSALSPGPLPAAEEPLPPSSRYPGRAPAR